MTLSLEDRAEVERIASHKAKSEATKIKIAEEGEKKLLVVTIQNIKETVSRELKNHGELIASKFETIEMGMETDRKDTKKCLGKADANTKWRWMMAGGLTIVAMIVVPLFLDLIKSKLAAANKEQPITITKE